MFMRIMEHVFEYENSHVKVDKSGGVPHRVTKHGVPMGVWMSSGLPGLFDDMTRKDAIDIFYHPLWNKSNAEYVPDVLRALYFDCCVVASQDEAVRLLRETVGVAEDKVGCKGLDTGTTLEAHKLVETSARLAKRFYAGRLSSMYARLGESLGVKHMLNVRLIACHDLTLMG